MQNNTKKTLSLAIVLLTLHASMHAMLSIPRTLVQKVVQLGRASSSAASTLPCDKDPRSAMLHNRKTMHVMQSTRSFHALATLSTLQQRRWYTAENNNDTLNKLFILATELPDSSFAYELTNRLLEKHADPNPLTWGETPLMSASRQGRTQIVKLLLEHHADQSITDEIGNDALTIAATHGHAEVAQMLIESNPYPDLGVQGKSGQNALYFAICNGHTQAAQIIINNRTDSVAQYEMLLWHAIKNKQPKSAQLLFEACPEIDIDTKNKYGETPLWEATRLRDHDMVQLLIGKGADIQVTVEKTGSYIQYNGTTPFTVAAKNGDAKALQLFVDAGININMQNKNGNTALMHIIERKEAEEIPEVLAIGADPYIENNDGDNAITRAIAFHHSWKPLMQALLDNGVDINRPNQHGDTALSIAGHDDPKIKFLLANGASIDTLKTESKTRATFNNSNRQALIDAIHANASDAIQSWFYNNDPNLPDEDGNYLITWAASFPDPVIAEALMHELINRKISSEVKNSEGETPLTIAVKRGNIPIAQMLLAKPNDYNNYYDERLHFLKMSDQNNLVPIELAMLSNNDEMFNLIYQYYEYNVNMQHNDGKTLLMYAAIHQREDIVRKITTQYGRPYRDVPHNALTCFQDNNGWTALMYAMKHDTEIAQYLLFEYHHSMFTSHGELYLVSNTNDDVFTLAKPKSSIAKKLIAKASYDAKALEKLCPDYRFCKKLDDCFELDDLNNYLTFIKRTIEFPDNYPALESAQVEQWIKIIYESNNFPKLKENETPCAQDACKTIKLILTLFYQKQKEHNSRVIEEEN